MPSASVFMGTTKISAEKTAGEIIQVLVRSGARQIATEYSAAGKISGLRFMITADGAQLGFSLPVRTELLVRKLRNDKDQAERVAWRQLLRWTEAQLAMIEVGMVKPDEVYAPYMLHRDGRTLYQVLTATKFKALCAPGE